MGKKFGDIPRGIFIVRGENVVLLGEIVSWSVWLKCTCIYSYINNRSSAVCGGMARLFKKK